MARWSVVVNRVTGAAVSFCTAGREAPAAVLEANGLEVVDLGEHPEGGPDQSKARWDAGARRLVAVAVRDRLDDVEADGERFPELSRLLRGSGRARLREELGRLLGPLRQRRDHEPIELG